MPPFDLEDPSSQAMSFFNAAVDREEILLSLPEKTRSKASEASHKAVRALIELLVISPELAGSSIAAAFSHALHCAEHDVAENTAIHLLEEAAQACLGNRESRKLMERLAAFLGNVRDPESNAWVILKVAKEVEVAIARPIAPKSIGEDERAGDLMNFLETLEPGIERRVTKENLTDWLSRYSEDARKGKLTLTGITANIIQQGHLAGARANQTRASVVQRVQKLLKSKD